MRCASHNNKCFTQLLAYKSPVVLHIVSLLYIIKEVNLLP